jgi:flavin-dependent dehydrogenase
MNDTSLYDCAIIGGGVGGLALSVQLARGGARVVLFEKGRYPFHKVCGEYVSLESAGFLRQLGVPLDSWEVPVMKQLMLSAPRGAPIVAGLPLGGLGVSRYRLDAALADIARAAGVDVREGTKVTAAGFQAPGFQIRTSNGHFQAAVCCACFGKYANLDVQWQRGFTRRTPAPQHNYIGVKYHVRVSEPGDRISLHAFPGGYCGLSAIEEGRYCLCYLTNAARLRDNSNSFARMEQRLLSVNPRVKKIFGEAEFLFDSPLTISHISFERKEQVKDHILMIGDAAGMIAPLCGNGMSMALHASRIAAPLVLNFLHHRIDRFQLESSYQRQWKETFSARLRTGRMIQGLLGNSWMLAAFMHGVRPFPQLTRSVIRRTHGRSF